MFGRILEWLHRAVVISSSLETLKTKHDPQQAVVSDPALSKELDKVISRDAAQHP